MPKYSPESKSKLECKVKEFDSAARDHIRHMSDVVQKDARTIANVSRKIRPSGTIEAGEQIRAAVQQSGKEVGKEFGHQKKSLEDIVLKKGSKLESECRERANYSELNYVELTKASGNIKETATARSKINQAGQVSQKDTYMLESLRETVYKLMQNAGRRAGELGHEMKSYEITNTLHFLDSGAATEYMVDGLRANQAAMETKHNKTEADPWELKIVPEENLDHQLCPRAKKEIWKANAAKEEIEAKLKAGRLMQERKQVDVPDEISGKRDRNYGRPSILPGEQGNLYKQKDTYE